MCLRAKAPSRCPSRWVNCFDCIVAVWSAATGEAEAATAAELPHQPEQHVPHCRQHRWSRERWRELRRSHFDANQMDNTFSFLDFPFERRWEEGTSWCVHHMGFLRQVESWPSFCCCSICSQFRDKLLYVISFVELHF